MEDPVVPLERKLYGHPHPLTRLSWEKQFEKVLSEHGWEKVPNWECLFVNREKGLFLSVYVDEKKNCLQSVDPMWKILMKDVDLGEPKSFLDHVCLGCTERECQTIKDIVDDFRSKFESRISAGGMEKLPRTGILSRTFPHGLITWKVMQRNAWKDIANWLTKQFNSYTKSQHHALTTTNSRKKKWDLLERSVKSLLTDCPDLSFLGSCW